MPRPRPWAPRLQSGSKPLGRVSLSSPVTNSRWLALSPWDVHTISRSGNIWSESPLPLALAPHSGRLWTQNSLSLCLSDGPFAYSALPCTSPRSRQLTVALNRVWACFPSSGPRSGLFMCLAFPPNSAFQNHVPNRDHLPSGPCWGTHMCAHCGVEGSKDLWHLHPHHVLVLLSFLSSLYLLPCLAFLLLFFFSPSSRLPWVLQTHLLAILDPKGFTPIHSPLGIRSVALHQDFEPPHPTP